MRPAWYTQIYVYGCSSIVHFSSHPYIWEWQEKASGWEGWDCVCSIRNIKYVHVYSVAWFDLTWLLLIELDGCDGVNQLKLDPLWLHKARQSTNYQQPAQNSNLYSFVFISFVFFVFFCNSNHTHSSLSHQILTIFIFISFSIHSQKFLWKKCNFFFNFLRPIDRIKIRIVTISHSFFFYKLYTLRQRNKDKL
jgi:hypothetical protein